MASSDEKQTPTPPQLAGQGVPPGEPTKLDSRVLDMGAHMLQALKPIRHIQQHVCTFALYAHDPSRQIEVHHFCSRLSQDLVQCAVYNSDAPSAHLIGVEYIVSDRLFATLPEEEKKLWHTHAYEIKSGLWMHPGVPEAIGVPELQKLAKSYGKFWCTWQVDRGDCLPLGAPALMISPQSAGVEAVRPDLVSNRDRKYKISSVDLMRTRVDQIEGVAGHGADYTVTKSKGIALDVHEVELKAL